MRRGLVVLLVTCLSAALSAPYSPALGAPSGVPAASLDNAAQKLARSLAAVRQGKVVLAKPGEVYIDLGQQDGVSPGLELALARPGEPVKDDQGNVLGQTEESLGRVRVEAVTGPRLCKAVPVAPGGVAPQKGDLARETMPAKRLVAVTQFTVDGKATGLTWSIQHLLQQRLAREGFQVVERDALSVVLKELKLGATGVVDNATAARIGKAAAAEAIVLGSVVDAGPAVRIYARLVDTESAAQLRSDTAEVVKDAQVTAQLGQATQDATTAVRVDLPQDPELPGSAAVAPAAAPAAGRYHSALSTRLPPLANIEMVRTIARQKFEDVRLAGGQLAWRFPSGSDGFLSPQGFLVVASAKPLDGLAQRDSLDTDLASGIDMLGTLFPEVFTEINKYAARFDASTYYADQAGVLHRVFLGLNHDEKVPAKVDWVLNAPNCRVLDARLTTWNEKAGYLYRPATVSLDGTPIELPQTAAFGQATIAATKLLDGPHRLVIDLSAGGYGGGIAGQFELLEVSTEPTEKRFFVTGPLAERARVTANRPISTLWPSGDPGAAPASAGQ